MEGQRVRGQSGANDAFHSWLHDHGTELVKKAVQQYSTDLLKDIEIANRLQTESLWNALADLRERAHQEPQSARSMGADEVTKFTKRMGELGCRVACLERDVRANVDQLGVLERRIAGFEQNVHRMQGAESSLQKEIEDMGCWAKRLTELETHRDAMQSALTSHVQDQESMRHLIASDLVLLASDEVKKKEDLNTHHWVNADLDCDMKLSRDEVVDDELQDVGDLSGSPVSRETSPKSFRSERGIKSRTSSEITNKEIGKLRHYDCYELQPSVWDAALFLGLGGFRWHEQLILGVAYMANFGLQSVLCLMVLHLGTSPRSLDDLTTEGLKDWFEHAQPSEVRSVCGPHVDHALSTSHLQMMLASEVDEYFEKAVIGFSWGPLLTITVIALWTCTMASQARNLTDFTVVLFGRVNLKELHTATRMTVNLKSVQIIQIPLSRFLWMVFGVLLQLTVIVILFVFGSLWLARTHVVTELLLNAVSLAFVTDTDELVFHTMVPTILRSLVMKTEPLPLQVPRSSHPPVRSTISLVTIVVLVVIFWHFPVSETSKLLHQMRAALCGDDG